MNNTNERFQYLKANLEAKFNVKNPIVEGVYHIVSLQWTNSPDGKQMIFFARCHWKEYGTRDFDLSFTTNVCINSLFSRVAVKPDVVKLDSRYFAILPEHGSDSFSSRYENLSAKLKGLKIQIEEFSVITNSYNKPQSKVIWNFYVPKDVIRRNDNLTSDISNYKKLQPSDIMNQCLNDEDLFDSILKQHSEDLVLTESLLDVQDYDINELNLSIVDDDPEAEVISQMLDDLMDDFYTSDDESDDFEVNI